MKRVIPVFLLAIWLISITSCSWINMNSGGEIETSVNSDESAVGSLSNLTEHSQNTTSPSYSIGYTINTGNFNVSFEDILNLCEEITGINLDELAHSEYGLVHTIEQDDYHIEYIDNKLL